MQDQHHDPIDLKEADYREFYVPTTNGVNLRVMNWIPKAATDDVDPILFVPGWVSVESGWADLLREIGKTHPLYYIETREKQSAQHDQPQKHAKEFSIERFAEDLTRVCNALPIDLERTVLCGSSLGATSILHALKENHLPLKAAFCIGPNSEFHVPAFLRWIPHMPAASYHIIKYFIIWYLQHFRVDSKNEPEQIGRYRRTLLEAHPQRIKLSCMAFMNYRIWSELEQVSCPVGIAYASTDKLHGTDSINRMAELIGRSTLIPCESNKYMHSAAMANDIENYLNTLQ